MTQPVLSVRDLTIAFAGLCPDGGPGPAAVETVSFDLHRGRVLALVGESGSGKSATAMAILGLLPPGARVTGSIRLDGEELTTAGPAHLRRVRGGRIGTIFQEPMGAFTPTYRIGAQLAEALGAHGRRAGARDRTIELLRTVGLRDPHRIAHAFPHELSGGQLQRAMIAMAISCDPVALIADEPTTALDVTVQAGILELLRSLRATRDTAVLLITHDMGVVADLADDVVVLRHGHVVEEGPVETIFARPRADYTRELLDAVPRLDRLSTGPWPAKHRLDAPAAMESTTGSTTASTTGSTTGSATGSATGWTAGSTTGWPAGSTAGSAADSAAAEVRDVRIAYGADGWARKRVVAVDGVSFAIAPGRTFGLVGESGSGKSTLGRAFAGLLPVQTGSVTVAGVDLATASRRQVRQVRRSIGYVFQDPASSLNPRSTAGDLIAEPLRLHTHEPAPARRARALELLDAVRLPSTVVDRFPHELSGGQRQRVAIARAIALRPTLLIADEPTSALDVSVQAHVLALLADLQRDFGFACLLISHDLAVVRQLAQWVAVLRAGRVVEQGPVDRVLAAPEDPYTRRLIAAAPVADPVAQRERRAQWQASADDEQEVA